MRITGMRAAVAGLCALCVGAGAASAAQSIVLIMPSKKSGTCAVAGEGISPTKKRFLGSDSYTLKEGDIGKATIVCVLRDGSRTMTTGHRGLMGREGATFANIYLTGAKPGPQHVFGSVTLKGRAYDYKADWQFAPVK